MGKGEIARNKQFLLFPQCFQLNQIIVYPFVRISDIISLFAAELEGPKIGISGKGLSLEIGCLVELNYGKKLNWGKRENAKYLHFHLFR